MTKSLRKEIMIRSKLRPNKFNKSRIRVYRQSYKKKAKEYVCKSSGKQYKITNMQKNNTLTT